MAECSDRAETCVCIYYVSYKTYAIILLLKVLVCVLRDCCLNLLIGMPVKIIGWVWGQDFHYFDMLRCLARLHELVFGSWHKAHDTNPTTCNFAGSTVFRWQRFGAQISFPNAV